MGLPPCPVSIRLPTRYKASDSDDFGQSSNDLYSLQPSCVGIVIPPALITRRLPTSQETTGPGEKVPPDLRVMADRALALPSPAPSRSRPEDFPFDAGRPRRRDRVVHSGHAIAQGGWRITRASASSRSSGLAAVRASSIRLMRSASPAAMSPIPCSGVPVHAGWVECTGSLDPCT